MPDQDGYPTDEELERLRTYDLLKEPLQGLIDLIKTAWWCYRPEWNGPYARTFYLATGGWSGNEDIIATLEQNHLFWSLYWKRSERGGAYWFDIGRSVMLGHGKVTLVQEVAQ